MLSTVALALGVIAVVTNSASGNIFDSVRSEVLHLASEGKETGWHEINSLQSSWSKQMSQKAEEVAEETLHSRHRRSEDSSSEADPNNWVTVAQLNDNHSTLIVHWAGAGSDAILALAKNSAETSSSLFISKDYGKTFSDAITRMQIPGSTNETAVVHKYYNIKEFNSLYVFSDIRHGCIFTTSNMGDHFNSHCQLSFTPRTLKLNPKNPRFILGMDEESHMSELFVTKDFGNTWRSLSSHVKSFHWGVPPHDDYRVVYVEKETDGEVGVVLKIILDDTNTAEEILIENVKSFELRGEYMFAVKSVHLLGPLGHHDPTLQLWVSHNRDRFYMAQFPLNYTYTDFYVADASEGQVLVCVSHNSSFTNLYISEVHGYKFSLSLEKIVFFNPKVHNHLQWLRFYTNKTFADITKISGVNGIYIASQQVDNVLDVEKQRSLISLDKGGQWQPIPPPEDVLGKASSDCTLLNNCSLHLTQEFHKLYPGTQASSILSQESAPGLVVASGVLGKTLKADADVFVSSDAGITWRQVLSGNYFYAIGDHGGIIVAIHQFEPTNQVIYSIDEGATWQEYKFIEDQIRVYGLLTEPGEKTTIFSIFGSRTAAHSWLVLQIDFLDVFNRVTCKQDDYKTWSVSKAMPEKEGCLLGHVTEFQRRRANVHCYNGRDFVRRVEKKNCSCTREDFECDYGFKESRYGMACHLDPEFNSGNIHSLPPVCNPGDFYQRTRGYRKVAGDTCEGGAEHRFAPLLYSCPIQERAEFLILMKSDKIQRLDLVSETLTTLVQLESSTSHVAFDYQDNCLVYVYEGTVLKRRCYSDENSNWGQAEMHVHEHSAAITGLAFEWTGRVLYIAFAEKNEIQVLSATWAFERTIYTNSSGVYKPRNLIVDPHHGYLFFVGATQKNGNDFAIFRAVMDGSDDKVHMVANSSVVSSNTRIALDLQSEQLYWFSSRQILTSDIMGQEVRVLYHVQHSNAQLSGIAIYKNDLYVSSASFLDIRHANKNEPNLWEIAAHDTHYVLAMEVVSNVSQHASSACSSYHKKCSQLCLPRPTSNTNSFSHQNRTCLCGDGYMKSKSGAADTRDETCLCETGERMVNNGTCVVDSNATSCAPDKLSCSNGRCVMAMWKCDGDDDCGDGSDERDCVYSECGADSFTCHSGKCIPLHWQCDREDDCRDGHASDEMNCDKQNCTSDQFRCANGYCINNQWRCDLDDDCHDHSDEEGCANQTVCHTWAFRCNDGHCIDSYSHCNGHVDCPDGSDESDCKGHPSSNCSSFQFGCESGDQCILAYWRCDNDTDCNDGSDEDHCEDFVIPTVAPTTISPPWICGWNRFRCKNGFCIDMEERCNFIDDCGDYSDEEECIYRTTPQPSTPSTTACRWCRTGSQCIPQSKFCDGQVDCRDASDEEGCGEQCESDQFFCYNSTDTLHMCIPATWRCDGDNDCDQHEDETFCSDVTVPTDEVSCIDNSGNIPRSSVCDKHPDCRDGSDELNCNYIGPVPCSNFDDREDVCCSLEQCGHFVVTFRWGRFHTGGHCYPSNSTQGTNTCPTRSVDYTCEQNQFKCGDKKQTCLAQVQVCNFDSDCVNGKDEENCQDCVYQRQGIYEAEVVTNSSVEWQVPSYINKLAYGLVEKDKPFSQVAFHMLNVTQRLTKVTNLLPARNYHFSFMKDHCVMHSSNKVTLDGVSSKPTHLKVQTVRAYDAVAYGVSVMWKKPDDPNGKIKSFMVYHQEVDSNEKTVSDVLSDSVSVDAVRSNGVDYKTIVVTGIELGKIFHFWVAAINDHGEGQRSDKVEITISDSDLSPDLKVTVKASNETALTLAWQADPKATGYRATLYMYNNQYEQKKDLDKGVTTYTFADLCPGSTVQVGVQAKYKDSDKASGRISYPVSKTGRGLVTLKGTLLSANIVNINMTDSTTALVNYRPKPGTRAAQKYIISYSTRGRQGVLVDPTRVISFDPFSHEVTGLLACETYFLGVSAGHAACPMSNTRTIVTGEDLLAAPKHIQVQRPEIHQGHYRVNLTWESPCAYVQENLTYAIRVQMGNMTPFEILSAKPSSSRLNHYLFEHVHSDETYRFSVRVNVRGSQESRTVSVQIPQLNGPELFAKTQSDGSITVLWVWPAKGSALDFKEYVLKTTDVHHSMVWTNHTSDTQLHLKGLPANRDFVFRVEAMSKTDTIIAESDRIQFAYYPEVNTDAHKDDTVSINKVNFLAIVIPVSLLVVILAAGLVVFIVRHKRLQRSFLAFANSHYNIQSGTTTFSDDLDGDEPMIQGFSDDEPLVLA